MRLLNVETLCLDTRKPETKYAILSHRWGDGEVLFADISGDGNFQRPIATAKEKSGWAKVMGACNQAKRDGFEYIWIDTCCIDKSSSAELNEELNSMFRYYQEAAVCYGYLEGLPNYKEPAFHTAFETHKWFTRGWTLQELIAPKNFIFFTSCRRSDGAVDETNWVLLGNRATPDMKSRVSKITGIDVEILDHTATAASFSVAKRMSWAAKRETMLREDRAYCLLGLFNVNMPLIYGEGDKAFIRLQEEIMKESNDESLFAWRDSTAEKHALHGLLARSPDMFRESGQFFGYYDWEPRRPYFKTNHGLRITLPLKQLNEDFVMAALNCPAPARMDGFAGIVLRRVTSYENFDKTKFYEEYARVDVGNIFSVITAEDRGKMTTLYVRSSPLRPPVYPNNVLQLLDGPERASGYSLYATMGARSMTLLQLKSWYWIPQGIHSAFKYQERRGRLTAMLAFKRPNHTMLTILLGSLSEQGDVCAVVEDGHEERDFPAWEACFQNAINNPPGYGTPTCPVVDEVRVIVDQRIVQNTKYRVISIEFRGQRPMFVKVLDGINESLRNTMVPVLLSQTIKMGAELEGQNTPWAKKANR